VVDTWYYLCLFEENVRTKKVLGSFFDHQFVFYNTSSTIRKINVCRTICRIWMYQYNFCTLNTHNWLSRILICPNRRVQLIFNYMQQCTQFSIFGIRGDLYIRHLLTYLFPILQQCTLHLTTWKKIDCTIIDTTKFITIQHFSILGPSLYMFICFHCLAQLQEWTKGGGLEGVALCLFYFNISSSRHQNFVLKQTGSS
jgi:hypothetical protein